MNFAPCCSLGKSRQYGLQVTRLEICICDKLRDVLYKEADMAVLACIIVACSARLESLDLTLDWSSTSSVNPYVQHLLVRPFHISVPFIMVPCFASAEEVLSCRPTQITCAHSGRMRRCCASSCFRCTLRFEPKTCYGPDRLIAQNWP